MRFARAITLLSVVGLLASCGSDDGPDAAADQQAADAAIDAFEEWVGGEGFTVDESDDDDSSDLEFSGECAEFEDTFGDDDETLPGETASAESDDYVRGSLETGEPQETVAGSVAFVADEDTLDAVLAEFTDERLPGCLEEALSATFDDPEVSVSDLTVAPFDISVADDAAAIRASATLASGGVSFPFVIDFGVAQAGREGAVAAVSVVGADEPGIRVEDALTQLLADA